MDSHTDRTKEKELLAPAGIDTAPSPDVERRSRRLLRFLVVYIPLEFILVLALAAAVQA